MLVPRLGEAWNTRRHVRVLSLFFVHVVGREDLERHRLSDRTGELLRHVHRRAGEGLARGRELEHRRQIAFRRVLERFDLVVLDQAHRHRGGLAVGHDRPGVALLGSEVLRHLDREHTPAAAELEVGRLAQVGTAGLDPVVRADRNLDRLLLVAIEITEQQVVAAVGVLIPAFEGRVDGLSAVLEGIQRQLPALERRQRQTEHDREHGRGRESSNQGNHAGH